MSFYHFKMIFLIVFVLTLPGFLSPQDSTRQWTVMVFLNGDNNLDREAMMDFKEMTEIGSTGEVNVVVQIDRCKKREQTNDFAKWSQTLRFHVEKDMKLHPKYAKEDIGEVNMGDGKVLADFVKWSMDNYPAEKYIFILWDHGWGWRDLNFRKDFRSINESPFKAISLDETLPGNAGEDFLYNREIQNSLGDMLGGRKIDIIGMDACLMAIIETAYAFRDIAKVMVASQDLELGTGWKYDDILKRLVENPGLNADQLSIEIIKSYRDTYRKDLKRIYHQTSFTLSAIDLGKIQGAARQISGFAKLLTENIHQQYNNVKKARDSCRRYAYEEDYNYYHIDFIGFLEEFSRLIPDNSLKSSANQVIGSIKSVVLEKWANKISRETFGSNGLCIYFPPSKTAYIKDKKELAKNGYEKENKNFPVEFVQKEFWCDFLHIYLNYMENIGGNR